MQHTGDAQLALYLTLWALVVVPAVYSLTEGGLPRLRGWGARVMSKGLG